MINSHWRRKWQPIPVFLPEESHGQRSLGGQGPWGHRESDTTEVTEHACMGLSLGKLGFMVLNFTIKKQK